MAASTEFRGAGLSKSRVAVGALSITLALGVLAGVTSRNMSSPTAPPAHIAQLGSPAPTVVPSYGTPGVHGFRIGAHI